MNRNPFRRFPHPDLVQGIRMAGPVNGWYRAELSGLSVAGSTPGLALVRLLQTAARDLESTYLPHGEMEKE